MKKLFYSLSFISLISGTSVLAGLDEDLKDYPHLLPIARQAAQDEYKVEWLTVQPQDRDILFHALDSHISDLISACYQVQGSINKKWDFNYQATNDLRQELAEHQQKLADSWSDTFLNPQEY